MKLLILLSTWNGCKYLRELLTSILNQEYNDELTVLVRDDGSSDNTIQIIEEMKDGRVEVICGENLGAKGSFLALLSEARRRRPDFVALADQDDVWLPRKLQCAVERLHSVKGPALYCSALNLVDENLQPIGTYYFNDIPSFEASFFTNCTTGCTCVFNRDLLDLIDVLPNQENIFMHDWWLYIISAAFGTVIYDSTPMILYRQHSSNQVGMHLGLSDFFNRIRRLLLPPVGPSRLVQAREFARIYGNCLELEQFNYLSELIKCENSLVARVKFGITRRPRRRKLIDDVAAFVAFTLGR